MAMNKLNYLCDIKSQISEVNNIRKKIREEMELITLEDRCLQEFKREMESLNQEKMTHVEELRQIHSDINMLDNVQKQSEEDRNRRIECVKDAYQQLQNLKTKIDKMCNEIDMPRMYENDDEQFDLSDKRFLSHSKTGSIDPSMEHVRSIADQPQSARLSSSSSSTPSNRPLNDNTNSGLVAAAAAAAAANNSVGSFSSSLASLMSGFQDRHQYGRMISGSSSTAPSGNGGSIQSSLGSSFHPDQSSASSVTTPAAFRQQPPPMKSCGSCHQQIHRNAPICPLCKAKSRSRHPKRRNNQRN